ncbi:MAG: hypothetical protein LH603_20275 [Pseudonocardia sp.]|nr:hypothetical protein [Pseudonocardia sp.]
MRTTLDLDGTVLHQLKERQRLEGKSLGQLASELLAKALAETADAPQPAPRWIAQPMHAHVDLEDRDALELLLGEDR